MSDRGHIKFYRATFDNQMFRAEPFTEREAFIWLIAEASIAQRELRVGQFLVLTERGELLASLRMCARRFGWQTGRVRGFLARLERFALITMRSDQGVRVVRVSNFDLYALPADQDVAPWEPDGPPGFYLGSVHLPETFSRGPITAQVRRDVMARDGGRCIYCGDEGGPFHLDHKVPVSKGGLSVLSNLFVACRGCNLSKGSRSLEEWRS